MAIYDQGLGEKPANFSALTPLSFLPKAAAVYPERIAVIHGARRFTWREFYGRTRRLAAALAARGVGRGTTVAAMLALFDALRAGMAREREAAKRLLEEYFA